MTDQPSRGMSLHTKILLGLVLGAVCGVAVNLWVSSKPARPEYVGLLAVSPGASFPAHLPWPALAATSEKSPDTLVARVIEGARLLGQIFLNMLFMTVVPLVFASLAAGVARLGGLASLGRIGAKTFGYFVLTMSLATAIGLALVNTIRPGEGLPEDTRARLVEKYQGGKAARPGEFGLQTFVNIVPRNPLEAMVKMDMLQVIFFALLIGVGLTVIDPERSRLLIQVLDGITDLMVVIIDLAMKIAPYGVFLLIFSVTASFGFDLLRPLGWYVLVVLLGLAIHFFGSFSLLLLTLSRINPLTFFVRVWDVIVTAFSTSSSNATLPTSIRVSEHELGVPPQIAGFVLPLGATMNMNGTALFEGVTVVFLAQVFGVPLGVTDQLIVIVLAVLMAIGAAGVPGGSIPLLVLILINRGIPADGIFIIIGVDRILDMSRTVLNVVGDITAATFVTRTEGYELLRPQAAPAEAVGGKGEGSSDLSGQE
jgi:DAACS family dicarboxylate/amino acid:cation (Na+ or H+) symporter